MGRTIRDNGRALLAQSVTCWFNDPQRPDRQVGWITIPASEYVRPVVRIAVRYRQQNGQWTMGALLSTLEAALRSAVDWAVPGSRGRSAGGLVGLRRLATISEAEGLKHRLRATSREWA